MGRNNQQRRAAKARAKAKARRTSSPPSGSAFGMPGAGSGGWPFAGPTSGWVSDDDLAMSWLHDLIELTTTWFDDVQRMDQQTLSRLMKMGAKVQKVLQFTGRVAASATPGGKRHA